MNNEDSWKIIENNAYDACVLLEILKDAIEFNYENNCDRLHNYAAMIEIISSKINEIRKLI